MVGIGAQVTSVNPSLRKRRRGYVADIYAQRGQATADVLARKESERLAAEQKFAEDTVAKNLVIANEKLALDKDTLNLSKASAAASKRSGQIGTGIQLGSLGVNLLTKPTPTDATLGKPISVFGMKPGGNWGTGIGAAATGAGVGQLVNSSKKWKKALIGGTVGSILGSGGGIGSSFIGGIGGALGSII